MRLEKPIFNRALWRTKRNRAQRGLGFLVEQISNEMAERLNLVERKFELALNFGASDFKKPTALMKTKKVSHWLVADIAENMVRGSLAPAFVGDEEALPIGDEKLNLITNILTLHWSNQLPLALKNIRHILKPDGLFLAVLFGAGTLSELRNCLIEAESEIKNGASARFAPLIEVRDAGNLLQAANFAMPVADLTQITVRYKNLHGLLDDIRLMAETQNLLYTPPFLRRDVLKRTAEIYHRKFAAPDGKLLASFNFVWLSGWAPHPMQPQPLKPGSAKMSLAEALKNQKM